MATVCEFCRSIPEVETWSQLPSRYNIPLLHTLKDDAEGTFTDPPTDPKVLTYDMGNTRHTTSMRTHDLFSYGPRKQRKEAKALQARKLLLANGVKELGQSRKRQLPLYVLVYVQSKYDTALRQQKSRKADKNRLIVPRD